MPGLDADKEEKDLWDAFRNALPSDLPVLPEAEKGATRDWLRGNLDNAIKDSDDWLNTSKVEVLKCVVDAAKCADALQQVFHPGYRAVDEKVFAAAVWAVKKYRESGINPLGVICAG